MQECVKKQKRKSHYAGCVVGVEVNILVTEWMESAEADPIQCVTVVMDDGSGSSGRTFSISPIVLPSQLVSVDDPYQEDVVQPC